MYDPSYKPPDMLVASFDGGLVLQSLTRVPEPCMRLTRARQKKDPTRPCRLCPESPFFPRSNIDGWALYSICNTHISSIKL